METTLINVCKNADVEELKRMSCGKKKLTTKSRSKEFENLFQRALFEVLGSKKEVELVQVLCDWCEDVNESITEKQVMSLLARGKYDILNELIRTGLNLSKLSYEVKYKTLFDKMFKNSIRFARVDEIKYLMSIFDIDLIDEVSIVKWLVNEEDMASLIDKKLSEKGCSTLLNFLLENGVNMEKIIKILN